MVTAEKKGESRINLKSIRALCVDSNNLGLDILGQTLMGFGVEKIIRAQSGEEARALLQGEQLDLLLLDSLLADETGYELVRWLRRNPLGPNRYIPTIIVTGHTRQSLVHEARDCGANYVVSKPTSPTVLLQRILWVARGGRAFVEAETYAGPDRRYKFEGLPSGGGRRSTDLSGKLDEAAKPNLSQDEIDNVFKPQRVAL